MPLKKSYSRKTDFLGTLPFFQARNLFFGNNFFLRHFVKKKKAGVKRSALEKALYFNKDSLCEIAISIRDLFIRLGLTYKMHHAIFTFIACVPMHL
jgi:hypothetical protein